MKNIIRVFLLTAGLILAVNSSSYAIVDISAYGGYTFNGEAEDVDALGLLYGAKAHINSGLPVVPIELGLGAYYQQQKIKWDNSFSTEFDATRQTIGLDFNVIITIPIIHPYGRFTYAFWDKITDGSYSDTENFKAWGLGAGVEFTVIPFFRIYGEFMYESTKHDAKLTTSSVNLGVKFDF